MLGPGMCSLVWLLVVMFAVRSGSARSHEEQWEERKRREQALKAQREKRAAELLNRERRERGGDLEMTSLSDKLSKFRCVKVSSL